jgi:hypothetical protein
MADDSYKYLGLLTICILAAGLTYIVVRWPNSKHITFSQHIAASKASIIYYIVLFGVVLTLLTLFFIKWFIPNFEPSIWFGVFVITSSIAQFACTLIPEVGGWQSVSHRALAGLSGLLLIPALSLLLYSENIRDFGKVFVALGLSLMMSVIFTVLLQKGKPRYALVLQTTYFTAFFLPILIITYL